MWLTIKSMRRIQTRATRLIHQKDCLKDRERT
jgi:hypothetical protein